MSSQESSGLVSKVFFAFLAFLLFNPFFSVPPGTIGVVVTFGNVRACGPGVYTKTPLISEVINFTAKTQKLEETNTIPTKEGLNVELDTAV